MNAPLVSILIPTRNGAATLPALLDAISRQRVDFGVEIVAVDSGSTDGTADLLRARAVRVVAIDADSFDHGLARNVGIEQAAGDLVVLLVQDAVPASDRWLSALTAPLRSDERVAGAFARQHPRDDASALTRYYLSRWVASSGAERIVALANRSAYDALDPAARLELCAFDNVCSCIRRSIWIRHPFPATPIAEDIEWARDVLLAGYRIAYVPSAEVVHSHDRSVRYELARTYVLHRRLYELFALRTIPDLSHLARATASCVVMHSRYAVKEWKRPLVAGRSIALAFAWPLGQYLGALSAIRGWKRSRSRTV